MIVGTHFYQDDKLKTTMKTHNRMVEKSEFRVLKEPTCIGGSGNSGTLMLHHLFIHHFNYRIKQKAFGCVGFVGFKFQSWWALQRGRSFLG